MPAPITPEDLVHGRDLVSINVVPYNESIDYWQPNSTPLDCLKEEFHKFGKIREKLTNLYQSEFLANLMKQAINQKDHYKPVTHMKVNVGDVLLQEDNKKIVYFPLAIVTEIFSNYIEVTHINPLVDNLRNGWAYVAVFGFILKWKSHAIAKHCAFLQFIARIFLNRHEKSKNHQNLEFFYLHLI